MDSKDLATVVPEVHYDLIARVPAGTIVALAFLVSAGWGQAQLLSLQSGASVVFLVLLLGAGYVIGLLTTPIAGLISGLYRYRLWRDLCTTDTNRKLLLDSGIAQELLKPDHKLSHSECDEMYMRFHRFLKKNDEWARLELPKSQAETMLCANCAAAALIAIATIAARWRSVKHPHMLFALLALAIVATWAGYFRTKSNYQKHFAFSAMRTVKASAGGAG